MHGQNELIFFHFIVHSCPVFVLLKFLKWTVYLHSAEFVHKFLSDLLIFVERLKLGSLTPSFQLKKTANIESKTSSSEYMESLKMTTI